MLMREMCYAAERLVEPEEIWRVLVVVIFSVFWVLPEVKTPEEESMLPEVEEEEGYRLHWAEAVVIQTLPEEEVEEGW